MTTLITGAAGFVGAALAEALVARGDPVIAVDREPHPAAPATPLYRFSPRDLAQAGALDAILAQEGRTLVIGAAITADAAREKSDPAGIVAVNVGSVTDAVRAAAAHGVGRVLYLGSGAVYGESARGADALVEDATPCVPAPSTPSPSRPRKRRPCASPTRSASTSWRRASDLFGPFERDTGARDTLSAPYQLLRLAEAGQAAKLPRPCRRDWL